ncbi:MAG: SET domain-containing protein-lysine N-methyltransferase [Nanoarchaeota archaeon]|nr:SET domain-containing protein-lysine N-methyltransferase [Nanoarchaeota archaeon]
MKVTNQSNKFIEVRTSQIHNNGVFAKRDISKGTYIIEYKGRIISNDEADKISEREVSDGVVYLFEIDDNRTLDGGSVKNNDAKYINHSCSPNAESLNDNDRIWIVALRDIKSGEEITYDYCLETEDPDDHPCRCGALNCKGLIAIPIKIK